MRFLILIILFASVSTSFIKKDIYADCRRIKSGVFWHIDEKSYIILNGDSMIECFGSNPRQHTDKFIKSKIKWIPAGKYYNTTCSLTAIVEKITISKAPYKPGKKFVMSITKSDDADIYFERTLDEKRYIEHYKYAAYPHQTEEFLKKYYK